MYLQIDEGFVGHPKTRAFCGRMQDPNAAMYLIKLWTWAVRSAPTGDLSEMNPWSIEDVVGYRMADGKCYAAMVACGFLDEEAGSPRAIHNWAKRTGGDIVKMENEAARRRFLRLHRSGQCDPATCQFHRRSDDQSADDSRLSADCPPTRPVSGDGQQPDDLHQDKTRPVQARSGSGSVSPVSDSGSPGNPAGARSESHATSPPSPRPYAYTPRVFLAAKTPAFLRVFAAYPRKDKQQAAAQVFQELAEAYQGGEEALAAAIEAAFARGLLTRHPYAGPNATRPCLDTFLAERRWEDPESAPDNGPTGKPWEQQQRQVAQRKGAERAQERIVRQQLERELADGKAAG